jgi:hypothetical protein
VLIKQSQGKDLLSMLSKSSKAYDAGVIVEVTDKLKI